eukprot:TRINITY_DN66174_c0_g1_i1.p1 TRINITY_DN66174_c0_g1~~TRINITY_DN66174_c0_g1_i1.p1  ORF type:complete len:502 (-),score=76.20 TRINITY_DN66174_c0_g1_i1:233-1738(-)
MGKRERKANAAKKLRRETGKTKDAAQADMTPTQLRNARKRMAKKRAREEQQQKVQPAAPEAAQSTGAESSGKRRRKQADPASSTAVASDPSAKFLRNPLRAPVVASAKAYFHSHGAKLQVFCGSANGWRTHAKLAVRKAASGGVCIGLFAPGSHSVIEVPECSAHHASVNAAVSLVKDTCNDLGIEGYDDSSGSGELRYISIGVERSTSSVQLVLVWNSAAPDESSPLPKRLKKLKRALIAKGVDGSISCTLHSLWVHFHSPWKHDNSIFGREDGSWRLLYGPAAVEEELLSSMGSCTDSAEANMSSLTPVRLRFGPNVFRQANLDAFSRIVVSVRKAIIEFATNSNKRRPRVVELYGGVGTIGLHLVDLVKSLSCSDENPNNDGCFNSASADLPEKLRSRVTYTVAAAAKVASTGGLTGSDVVVVDPPRKGLDMEVLDALRDSSGPQRLIYVSCGFPAFQRDMAKLLTKQYGGWKLSHAEGHMLFPGADHLETFAVFDRA